MRKNLKILIVMIICILFNNVNAITTDKEPPVLRNIALKDKTKTQYTYDDRVYLKIDASDEVSGIKSINVWFTISRDSIPQIEGLIGFLDNEWWQDGNSGAKVLYDENNEPYFNIPKGHYNGVYYIYGVELVDNLDNRVTYNLSYPTSAPFLRFASIYNPKIDTELKYELINGKNMLEAYNEYKEKNKDKEKNIPPSIESYTIDKRTIKQGETATITLYTTKSSDKVKPQVRFIWLDASVDFSSYKYPNTTILLEKVGENTYSGTIDFDYAGSYLMHEIAIEGGSYLPTDCTSLDKTKCVLDPLTFVVKEEEGYIPLAERKILEVADIKLSKSEINPPAYLNVKVKISSTFEVGNRVSITFRNEKDSELYGTMLFDESAGYYIGDIKIDQYSSLGEYYLDEVIVFDVNDDYEYGLVKDVNKHYYVSEKRPLNYDLKINLTSEFKPDVITGTNATNFLEVIKKAENDAKIYIDAKGNSLVKKEVFELIKDTNKIIYIESDGIEWIFNGNDIKEPKDIDVSMDVYYDYDYSNNELGDYIDKALVLDFKDNGVLPGIATVRIKLDYVFKDYIGDKVYVYYYQDKSFETVVDGLLNINDNGYFEFKIDHNSTYILSTNKPDEKYITKNEEIININSDNDDIEKNEEEPKKYEEKNYNMALYIACGSILSLFIVLIIFIIIRIKRKKQRD